MNFEKLSKKLNFILTIISALLLLTYIVSSVSKTKTDKRKKIQTALLNPKYINDLSKIELQGTAGEIILQKSNEIWTVRTTQNDFEIPGNQKTILEFVEKLSKVINVYKFSDLSASNYKVLFPDAASFSVKYFLNDNNNTTLYFGKYDFSQNFRYLMTDKNTSVYEIDTGLDKFLNTSFQVWAEPNLISQNILGKISSDDIQRIIFSDYAAFTDKIISSDNQHFEEIKSQLLDLRHGGKLEKSASISEKEEAKLKIEMGNKKDIILDFYPIKDSSQFIYLVKITYDKYTIFNYKISQWTYSKIKEMML